MKRVGGATLVTRNAMKRVAKARPAQLEKLCGQLTLEHPEMASIWAATGRCLEAADHVAEAKRILHEMENASAAIAEQATSLCRKGDKILTHSASGNALDALLLAHKKTGIEVIVTESRPMLEGQQLAIALSRAGVPVTYCVDALAATLLPECRMVWVGADAVGEDFFVNKIGTLGIALAAQRLEVPLYVLCDQLKVLPTGMEWPTRGDHNPAEVWKRPPPGITVRNPYFEKIPLFLTRQILTD
jgi:ribose 1,5-bisphosphate isomerase